MKGGGIVGGDLSGACVETMDNNNARIAHVIPRRRSSRIHCVRTPSHHAPPLTPTGGTAGGPSAEGNHSALGARFFHDEGFIIPHSGAGAICCFLLLCLWGGRGSWWWCVHVTHATPTTIQSFNHHYQPPIPLPLTHTQPTTTTQRHPKQPGLVSMVSAGVHRNGSHFHIATDACPHLDGRAVAFGRVVEGMEVVKKVGESDEDLGVSCCYGGCGGGGGGGGGCSTHHQSNQR